MIHVTCMSIIVNAQNFSVKIIILERTYRNFFCTENKPNYGTL